METLLITQNINNGKKYDCEINCSQGWLVKKNAEDKHSPQLSSKIQLSEIPHQSEMSQIMCIRNELTGFYKTKALTEKYFRIDYNTRAEK